MKQHRLTILEKDELKKAILSDYVDKGMSYREIGRKYRVSQQTAYLYIKDMTPEQRVKSEFSRIQRMHDKLSTRLLDGRQSM